VSIEFGNHRGDESSDARVILASLIGAANLCPDKQLLNRVAEGSKNIALRYLAFQLLSRLDPLASDGKLTKLKMAAAIGAWPWITGE
jgi:hypothetical protein